MAFRMTKLALAMVMTILLSHETALAQYFQGIREYSVPSAAAGQQAVSANGMATLKRKPTVLRMYLELAAKGSSLDEALKKMTQRRENARAQLETLNAKKESINFGDPGLSGAKSPRQRQIESMVMARMQSRGKKPAKTPSAAPVTATVILTAQWSLETETPEQMLVLAQTLQDKVKAADLAGSKEAEKLSPEEEELAEEATQMMGSSGEQQTPAGQPYFMFIAKLSKEDREKLLSEAFAKAKSQAADLAKAADVELGPLTGLSGQCAGQRNFGDEEYNPYNNSSSIRRMLAQQTAEGTDETRYEAMSNDPASVSFHGMVQAYFRLGK
ncbi:MAG: SIMPL domain-containing protein [Thermoguttaceae bacterium]|jgi:uncharacterized protein YggE